MKSTITALDFGTSKVVTLIATPRDMGINNCDVLGVGSVQYEGFSNGEWNNPTEVPAVVKKSIDIAQAQAGNKHKSSDIYVGVPGEFTYVRVFNVKVDIQGTDPRVTKEHVEEIFRLADEYYDQKYSDENGTQYANNSGIIIHRSPAWFMVDGGKKTFEPIGLKGRELSAMVCFIVADECFPAYIEKMFSLLNYRVKGYFSSLMGQVKLYIPEPERDKVAGMIDMGYLNTDFVIAEGDAIIYQETIPIGSGHIKAALSEQLALPMDDNIENLKRQYQFDIRDENKVYEINSQDSSQILRYEQSRLDDIIHPVVDELCNRINEAIETSGCRFSVDSKLYLTGGGISLNRNARDYVASKLNRNVSEPAKVTINMTEPYFSSAMGLLDVIMTSLKVEGEEYKGIIGFFKKLFSI